MDKVAMYEEMIYKEASKQMKAMLKQVEEMTARQNAMNDRLKSVLPDAEKIMKEKLNQAPAKNIYDGFSQHYDPNDPWIFKKRPGLQGKAYKPPV